MHVPRSMKMKMFSISAVLISLSLPVIHLAQQEQYRIIEKHSFANEPIKITLVKTKKGVVKLGEKFSSVDDDWFKGLTIRVENSSNKHVNYISILIVIKRPQDQELAGQAPFGEALRYGVSPFQSQGSAPLKPAENIAPGGSIELALSDQSFEDNKAILKRFKFPDSVSHIELSVQEIGFEDGTVWSAGELWRRDSDNPDKLIPLSQPDKWFLISKTKCPQDPANIVSATNYEWPGKKD